MVKAGELSLAKGKIEGIQKVVSANNDRQTSIVSQMKTAKQRMVNALLLNQAL